MQIINRWNKKNYGHLIHFIIFMQKKKNIFMAHELTVHKWYDKQNERTKTTRTAPTVNGSCRSPFFIPQGIALFNRHTFTFKMVSLCNIPNILFFYFFFCLSL